MSEKKKLNIFQRGIFQITAFSIAYVAFLALTGFLVDSFEKWRFIAVVESAQRKGVITSEGFQFIKNLIESMGWVATFLPLGIGGLCLVAGWYAMKWTLNRNWSWPVTLSKVVEFRSAMRRLGVVDPKDWIPFVCKHDLSVFIATSPLISEEQENVKARQYKRAPNHHLVNNTVFELNTGRQTLCLDADDFERIQKQITVTGLLASSAAISEKDEEIKRLRANLARAVQDNEALSKERDELRGKVQIQPAQEDSRVERLRMEYLLWTAYGPVIDRLLKEATDGKRYITSEIEEAFAEEWQRRKDLQQRMKQLTGSENASPSESFMKAVKAEFKVQGKFSTGGRPRKNP